jgi:NhaA family Na+:H+ antiporter
MADETGAAPGAAFRLQRAADFERDHVRGGHAADDVVSIVLYGDYLCPYCRRLRPILDRLRQALGERLAYVFRHFPNEGAHPGSTFIARAAEAAANQGRFWEMHDRLYTQEPPLSEKQVPEFAVALGLDMARFRRDLESDEARRRVDEDLADGRRNGVTGTPTLFVDGLRYDGAWDFYSMLEALERPVAALVQRSARVFASLPASGGVVLILAAVAALLCANSPIAPYYRLFIESSFSIGPPGGALILTVGAWFSEGLLAFFFLLVGLEIRREMTVGALADWRAAVLPIIAAVGGVLAPTAIYLALNRGPTAPGWSVPTATDVAFALGILALLGERVPVGLRVFVAALAVVDDILSMLTLAVFYPQEFNATWLIASAVAVVLLLALNRGRVYASWPYVVVTIALWLSLHAAGVHAALAGVLLAAFLPTRPAPAAGPLLAQAATALAAHRAGADLGLGQPQPVGRDRAAPVAGRSRRTGGGAVERASDPAALRVLRDGGGARCRSLVISRSDSPVGRHLGARHRQAAGRVARIPAGNQGSDCHCAGWHYAAPVHRRRLSVRYRRHGLPAAGRPGIPARIRCGRGKDRRPHRLGPRRRARRGRYRRQPWSSRRHAGPRIMMRPIAYARRSDPHARVTMATLPPAGDTR